MRTVSPRGFEAKNVPIVNVIGRSVSLEKSGSVYMGLCPLHRDKNTPSLVVYPNTNSWCCFGVGCGSKAGYNGGDVIEWVRQKQGLGFKAACDWLETNFAYAQPTPPPKQKSRSYAKPVRSSLIDYWHSLLDLENRREYFYARGFNDQTIDTELWGWDGSRYTIPVWEGEPQESTCLGVRRRRSRGGGGPKYVGLDGSNLPTIWGRWHCKGRNFILAFAGELDAAKAVQDGLPAFSLVNGVGAMMRFPAGWPSLWLPDSLYCACVFDKKEEALAGRLAEIWSADKGDFSGRVVHWPIDFTGKDYCDWRSVGHSAEEFMQNVIEYVKV